MALSVPVVIVVAAFRETSCKAVKLKFPVVVVMAAPTTTSRAALSTKLPSVPVMAWFTFTSRAAFKVSVVGAVQVTTALTLITMARLPLAP